MGRFSPGDSGRGDYFWGDSEPHPKIEGKKTYNNIGNYTYICMFVLRTYLNMLFFPSPYNFEQACIPY